MDSIGAVTRPTPEAEPDRLGAALTRAYPRRRSHVRARAVEGEVLILDRRRQLVHQLNRTAGFIWDRCDGEHSVAAIAHEVAEAFDVDAAAARTDVAGTVRRLDAAGLVELWPA